MSATVLARGLLRQWRVWCATGCAGVLAALALFLLSPPGHTATTTLLLHHPGQADPARAIVTQSELLKSRTVAQRVVDRLDLELSGSDLISTYRVLPVSDDLLRLTVGASTGQEAVRRAQTVAEVFLEFRREELERQARVVVDALEERRRELTAELADVTNRINTFSATGQGEAAARELGDLLVRRGALSDQISQLRQQIDIALSDPTSAVERSRILDPASLDERSPLRSLAANSAAGVVAGTIVGVGWVLLREVGSDRVRRREHVAAALRTPVALCVDELPSKPAYPGGRLGTRLSKRNHDLKQVVNHLRRSLLGGPSGKQALVVVSIDSDDATACAVASLAMELVNEGRDVAVVDFMSNSPLPMILLATDQNPPTPYTRAAGRMSYISTPISGMIKAGLGNERTPAALRGQADVVLTLSTIDPALGAWHLAEWGTVAVALVTAGRSTATALSSTAQLVRTAGLQFLSAVLLRADRSDDSTSVPEKAAGS